MAGKRFTVRGRDLRWKEGRAKTRRSRPKAPPKPNLTLDLGVAAVASLLAAGVVFCFAFILSGSHGVPLYLGYAVIVNKKFWDGLPADVRTQLDGAMKDATRYANDIAAKENANDLESVRKSGKTQIYNPTPAERAA